MADKSRMEKGSNEFKKRQFLKQAATSTGVVGVGFSGLNALTGTASATTSGDGDSCSCKYEDQEWNPGIDEVAARWGSQTSNSMSWDNPGWTGFDICETIDPDNSADQLCIKTADEVTEEYPDCASGKAIYNMSFDIIKQNLAKDHVYWSYSIWIGVDNDGCVWVGEDSGQCSPISGPCTAYEAWKAIDDSAGEAVDYAEDVADEIQDRYIGDRGPAGEAILIGLIIIVLVLVLGAGALSGAFS